MARNIKIQGAVSGNANFDGNANMVINTTQANIATLTGNLSSSGTATITYPSGYNKDNCIVLGIMFKHPNNAKGTWGHGCVFNSGGYVRGSLANDVSLNDKIEINIANIMLSNGSTATVQSISTVFAYKLVLMKIA